MTEYPANEYVYRFPLKHGEFDCAQMSYQLEDALGLLLQQYEGQERTQGWATIDLLIPQLDLRTFAPLTAAQLAVVEHVVTHHKPIPDSYGGSFKHIVTRYKDSLGRVLVRNESTEECRHATGFLFGQRGFLVTAAHVVRPPWHVTGVAFGDDVVESDAGAIQRDDTLDLALVRLHKPRAAPALDIRRLLTLPGDLSRRCIAMGFPYVPGMHPSLSIREIRLATIQQSYLVDQQFIELSDDLRGGFSGSPVLTLGHSVAGVVIGYPAAGGSSNTAEWIERGRAVCLPDAALQNWYRKASGQCLGT